ncbi:P-loop containing nucleoside triphosphate hydrolase protein [Mycena polygramma]|nr:P-loop containing nucleoside triphosphate hydrolase protein [Mycena polygramma]
MATLSKGAASNLASGTTTHLQRTLLSDKPDVVIATPSRALALMHSKALVVSFLASLVIDEADLILSGAFLPKVYQSFLMTEDVEMLKALTLRNPVSPLPRMYPSFSLTPTKLFTPSTAPRPTNFSSPTCDILTLELLKGKCILFVNDFCVLNSELPLNSRYHTVQEYKGVYGYIIATTRAGAGGEENQEERAQEEGPQEEEEDEGEEGSETLCIAPGMGKDKDMAAAAKEYGVTHGVDFLDVVCALNFDLPASARAYTHRVHRARGALPFLRCGRIEREQSARGSKVQAYRFFMKQVEAFRYRMEDALMPEACSSRLYNPLDLEFLRHDKPLHPPDARIAGCRNTSSPASHPFESRAPPAAAAVGRGKKPGFVPFQKKGKTRGGAWGRGGAAEEGEEGKKKSDPLKKFSR